MFPCGSQWKTTIVSKSNKYSLEINKNKIMLALEERKYETICESPGGRGQPLRKYLYWALTIALPCVPLPFSTAGKLSPHE